MNGPNIPLRSGCLISRTKDNHLLNFVPAVIWGILLSWGIVMSTAETLVRSHGGAKAASDAADHAPAKAIKVAVVEDDDRLRQALAFQMGAAGFHVVPVGSAEEFLKIPDAGAFDCIVLDNFLPRMNGLQLHDQLRRTVPFVSVVFITGNSDLSLGMYAMRNGAVDFLEKPIDDELLIASILRAADRSRTLRSEHALQVDLESRHKDLTPREREVFALITIGLLNKQVGAELGTTERTVKAHRERVMSKMGAGSLADLVRMAGILQLHSSRGIVE
jgi:FixJ family two-component response regulator